MTNDKLLTAVTALTRLVNGIDKPEPELLEAARQVMAALVATDDWLPPEMARAHPNYYQQYLLYGDPLDRFSLVSFVWGPGQKTPVHDHTVWGVIGMLRGAERDQGYQLGQGGLVTSGPELLLQPGDVACVSPSIGDIHQVSNAYDDRVSVSIHLYGANIGKVRRHVYDPTTGERKSFISGYSNTWIPNLWASV